MTEEQFWFIHDNIEHAFQRWLITYEKRQALKTSLISYYNRVNGIGRNW